MEVDRRRPPARHIDWVSPHGESLGSDDKTIGRGQKNMSFTEDTTGWATGNAAGGVPAAT
jgi:hypothetical protein